MIIVMNVSREVPPFGAMEAGKEYEVERKAAKGLIDEGLAHEKPKAKTKDKKQEG